MRCLGRVGRPTAGWLARRVRGARDRAAYLRRRGRTAPCGRLEHDIASRARELVLACAGADPADPEIKHEFFLEQVEVATRPCATSAELRAQLVRGRQLVATAARPFGVVPLAVPVPVLAGPSGTPSPGERYGLVRDTYGQIAEDSMYCALQVHVGVEDDEEAVGVLIGCDPGCRCCWRSAPTRRTGGVPTRALRWRSQLWDRWPSSGPREPFGTIAGYHRTVASLVASGAILDEAMLNLDIRRSARFSTVELRLTNVLHRCRRRGGPGLLDARVGRGRGRGVASRRFGAGALVGGGNCDL